jgi:hypothetical protein
MHEHKPDVAFKRHFRAAPVSVPNRRGFVRVLRRNAGTQRYKRLPLPISRAETLKCPGPVPVNGRSRLRRVVSKPPYHPAKTGTLSWANPVDARPNRDPSSCSTILYPSGMPSCSTSQTFRVSSFSSHY